MFLDGDDYRQEAPELAEEEFQEIEYEYKNDDQLAEESPDWTISEEEREEPLKENTLANLLMTLLQQSLKRRWSFLGLATMVRIVLMYYINQDSFLDSPDEDLKRMLEECA